MLLLCNLESCCFTLFTELYWNIFNYRATLRSQLKNHTQMRVSQCMLLYNSENELRLLKKFYSFPWKIGTTINITISSVKYVCYRQAQHYKTGKYNARLSEYSLNSYSSTISENRIIRYPPGKKMNYFSFSLAYLSGQWINYKSLLLLPVLWRKKDWVEGCMSELTFRTWAAWLTYPNWWQMTVQLPMLQEADKDYIVLHCSFVEGIKRVTVNSCTVLTYYTQLYKYPCCGWAWGSCFTDMKAQYQTSHQPLNTHCTSHPVICSFLYLS